MINLNEKAKEREIRIFVSSTFRDMMEERDHLIKNVFPKLRSLCQSRGVELTEVDLRWGITRDQAEQGKVIEICLREIDRCRPFFIGILGWRYGWVPEPEEYEKHKMIIEDFPWVKGDVKAGLSITEMEIQYGVLRNKEMSSCSFFYFRDTALTPNEFCEEKGSEAEAKLEKLKKLISESEYPNKTFKNPKELEKEIEEDFKKYLDAEFPEKKKPSPIEQTRLDHADFARSRLKVYVGGEKYFKTLDNHVESTEQPLVITGESGTGKSALLANWIAHYQEMHPDDFVLYHFTGGAPDSSDHYSLMRRIMAEMKERFGIEDEIPTEQKKLAESFSQFLTKTPHSQRWVLVLDALNQLEDKDNARWLGWLPKFIPENIRVIVSTLPGQAFDALKERKYPEMVVKPLDDIEERKELIRMYLKIYTKELPEETVQHIANDPESENPLILRSLLDELRVFGVHEELDERIDYYLRTKGAAEFFDAVLQRLENDYEKDRPSMVSEVLSLIWSARRGLSEKELLEITGIPPLFWAPLYNALENHLVRRGGLLDFFHDFLRQAVEKRYLKSDKRKKERHRKIADYFEKDKLNERTVDELPFHLMKAEEWKRLKDYIGDLDVFKKLNTYQKKYELLRYWNAIEDRYDMVMVYQESLDLLEESGVSEEDLSYSLNSVARFLKDAAQYDGAEPLYRRALEIYEKVLGKEHPYTSTSLNNLAALLYAKGDYDGAEPLYRRSLEIYEKVIGKEHPDTALSLNNLATLLYAKGDNDGAEPLYRRALEIREKVLGKEHPDTATSLNNLAELLRAKGDYDGAEPLYRRSLKIREKVLGKEHPGTATSLNGLAALLYSKGDYDGAEPLYRRALEIDEKVLGKEHPDTATSLNNLAELLSDKGDYDGAEPLQRRALEIYEKVLGKEHPDTATSLNGLAALLYSKGDYDGAEPLFRRALEIYEKVLRKEHPNTKATRGNLSLCIQEKK